MGHETVMAKTTFFGSSEDLADDGRSFDFTKEYPFQEQLMDVGSALSKVISISVWHTSFCVILTITSLVGNFQQSLIFTNLPVISSGEN